MDPAVVGSAEFGKLFSTLLPGNFNNIGPEQIFSQPLVYTGDDGVQYVYVATTQNNLYKLDAKTGAIIMKRNMHVPFLTADLDGCVDINPAIGVTATGVIDPETGLWYLTAKTYSEEFQSGLFTPAKPPGRLNGRYYFHAINTKDLTEAPGFPKLMDGLIFRNNPNRMFLGGNQHARPGMLQVGDYIYTGWASHCVQYNFTGAIIGFHRTTGAVVEAHALQGGPEPITVKGAGVWMSGGGLSYDGAGSMFFATGNGYASQLPPNGASRPGRDPPTALEEAAVNMKINDNGTINVVDFFMPWEKTQLDGADKDLGTSPLALLPTNTFKCANVKRMGVVTGKSGKTYWLNLDNLGGYQMGANKLDNVPQVYQNENSVYAGAGVYPLEGGYIYINVIQYQTHIFKFSCDASGDPKFTKVADTPEKNAYVLGVGHGTTTSLNGQEGTGLYWQTDVEGYNLRIYNAVPTQAGSLTLLKHFNIPAVTKFSRPVFGNGRAYIGTTNGYLHGFGSPVNLPLNCSSPYTFDKTPVGSISQPLTVTCLANIDTQVTGLALTGNQNFNISSIPPMPFTLAKGKTFSFQAQFAPKSVGPLSSDVLVTTTNAVVDYSKNTPISLKGTANSAAPLLAISPNTMSFSVVVGQENGGSAQSAIFANRGDAILKINEIMYSQTSEKEGWVTPNTTNAGVQVGPFTVTNVPTTIAPNDVATVGISYNPSSTGNHALFIKVITNGGTFVLDVVGVAGTSPKALFQFEAADGSGWITYKPGVPFTFGDVLRKQTKMLKFRLTNSGSNQAGALSVTVSKPPYGLPGLVGAVNNVDLAEGVRLTAGQSEIAVLYCSVPNSQVNLPAYNGSAVWTINTGDPELGKQTFQFDCNAVTEQYGPLLGNGSSKYGYVGCFAENNPGRQLSIQLYGDNTNTNEKCITRCAAAGYTFVGTQYNTECWCGNALPNRKDDEQDCNYNCAGDENQICGGNGYFHNKAHMSLFADLTKFDGNTTSEPTRIPQTVGPFNFIGCYAETGAKTVASKALVTADMTVEKCAANCAQYTYFGIEYASECFCGNQLAASSKLTDSTQCSMTCSGSNSQYCGAGSRMQMYQVGAAGQSSSAPSVTPTVAASTVAATTTGAGSAATTTPGSFESKYTYMGCYNETHVSRALNEKGQGGGPGMTLESCAAYCSGFAYFGVEYGSECYCGNTLRSYPNGANGPEFSVKQTTEAGCNMKCSGNTAQSCGGADYFNLYYTNSTASATTTAAGDGPIVKPTPTGGPTAVPSAGNFAYLGCYNEVDGRALTNGGVANSSMTIELCATYCANFDYFGVEYSQECFCGNVLSAKSLPVTDGRCNMVCAADSTEICGGPNGLSMYKKNGTVVTSQSSAGGSSTVASNIASSSAAASATATPLACPSSNGTLHTVAGGSKYLVRCGVDPAGWDMPNTGKYAPTLEACIQGCGNTVGCMAVSWVAGGGACYMKSKIGFLNTNAGVWAATFDADATVASTSSVSSSVVAPAGNSSSVATSVTPSSSSPANPPAGSSAGASSTGSTNLSSSASAVASSSGNGTDSPVVTVSGASGSGSVTVSLQSTAYSLTYSSPSAGASSSSFSSAATTTTAPPLSSSSSAGVPAGSSPASSSAVAPSSATAPSSTAPTAVPTVSSYAFQGCYSEATSGRALSALATANGTSMTPQMCAAHCIKYAWFGLEFGKECYCGPYPRTGSANVTNQAECNMKCPGDSSALCGAGNRLQMYYSSDSTKASADPAVVQQSGNYEYYGCVVDPGKPRALSVLSSSDSMTVELCLATAEAKGYQWAGVEYGRECWMGNTLDPAATLATAASQCNMACKGAPGQICGAGSRLTLYKRSA
ncbi:hypothetical protein W97_03034 [Coniosporium apollinis CBS 100218]|uniref:WSC domain-containing protein n=1 Tax=Coniosporium apollinis (strain CBS 100218) TaxID=1168221 RepID=R7YQ66_CONA1|nr:uncharacterized protein W97_03034 [Coniosporium apollinis CBS 100218]EON63806.1 hypothetical protein W97_03034 [Coniosporium apollinis CBS 100218]